MLFTIDWTICSLRSSITGGVLNVQSDVEGLAVDTSQILSTVNAIKSAGLINAGSVIKSVQRGVREIIVEGTISIPISNVNTNKSLAIIETNANTDVYGNGAGAPLTHVLESNKIKVEVGLHSNDIYLSWQVIEFY